MKCIINIYNSNRKESFQTTVFNYLEKFKPIFIDVWFAQKIKSFTND
jgi:hypothetical protein